MKDINRGKQMKSVWEIRPPESWEKKFGKHPTQKPVALLERILLASSNEGDLVLDPFSGSGTTLLAAFRLRRHALGCEFSADFLTLSLRRLCSNLVQVQLSISSLELSFSSFDFPVDPLADPMDRSCSGGASAPRTVRPCSGGFTPPSASASDPFFRGGSSDPFCSGGASAPRIVRLCSGGFTPPSPSASDPFCSGGFTPPSSRPRAVADAVISSGARNLSSLRANGSQPVSESRNASHLSPQLQLVQQESRFYFIGRADRRVIFSVQADSLDDARQKFRASGHSDSLFIIRTETSIYLT